MNCGHGLKVRSMSAPSSRNLKIFVDSLDKILQDLFVCKRDESFRKKQHGIVRATKKLINGEFIVPKGFFQGADVAAKLADTQEKLVKESQDWPLSIAACTLNEHGSLSVKLDRAESFRKTIGAVVNCGTNYGRAAIKSGLVAWINLAYGKEWEEEELPLKKLRCLLVAHHTARLLEANGIQTKFVKYPSNRQNRNFQLLRLFNATQSFADTGTIEGRLAECRERLLLRARRSRHNIYFTESPPRPVDQAKPGEERAQATRYAPLVLDLWEYVSHRNLVVGKLGYDRNLGTLAICKEDIESSPVLEQLVVLEANHAGQATKESSQRTRGEMVFHVVSSGKEFHQQQVDVTWKILADNADHCQQFHLVCGAVLAQKGVATTEGSRQLLATQEFYRLRLSQTRHSSILKYGEAVKGEGWESTLNAVATGALKFEILGTLCRNEVKLDMRAEPTASGRPKGGHFVLYNYARLCTLFDHFNKSVQEGVYPELPGLESVDFSLLREEEEWQLLFAYVLPFPSMVAEAVPQTQFQGPRADIQTHKVCNFLVSLSRDLSSYYSRVHVLGEPRMHLLPIMYARLYLLKALQQVIHNALLLLDIEPLEQL